MRSPSEATVPTPKIIPSESNSAEMPRIMLTTPKMRRSLISENFFKPFITADSSSIRTTINGLDRRTARYALFLRRFLSTSAIGGQKGIRHEKEELGSQMDWGFLQAAE